MNLKALITTALVLGSSTVALASPRYSTPNVRDHRIAPTVAVRGELDVRYGFNKRPIDQRLTTRPVAISYPTPAAPVYDRTGMITVASFNRAFDGRQTIDFGRRGYEAAKLRIVSSDPDSMVYDVIVHYQDGQSQTFLWNHFFGSATDGQLGPNLDMHLAPNSVIQSIEVSALSKARLTVQLQA
jgi:hypothetical protein